MDKAAKAAFAKASGLQPSKAWNIFAKYGPHNSLGNRRFFVGIYGADHTCVWRREGKYLITTEPYKTAAHKVDSLLDFCERYGWEIILSDYPGWWNPPHTELWLLSPPIIGISPSVINQDLIWGHSTKGKIPDACHHPQ